MTRGAMLAMSAVMYAVSASHCVLNVAGLLESLGDRPLFQNARQTSRRRVPADD